MWNLSEWLSILGYWSLSVELPALGGDGRTPTLLTVTYLVTSLSNWLGRKDFPDYMPTSSGLAVALGRECSSFEGTGADSSESQVFLKIP